MDSTLSGRMSNERFRATSKDVVKSEMALMVLLTAEKHTNTKKKQNSQFHLCHYIYIHIYIIYSSIINNTIATI